MAKKQLKTKSKTSHEALQKTSLLFLLCTLYTSAQEHIKIELEEGFKIAARFYKTNVKSPSILIMHQCDREGNKTGFESLAKKLSESGMNVLEMDFRGFGKSKNETFTNFHSQMRLTTPYFPSDVEEVFKYLDSNSSTNDQFILIGASCAATQAIHLASKYKNKIKGLIFLSGSFWRGAPEKYEKLLNIPLFIATSDSDRVTARMKQVFEKNTSKLSKIIIYKGKLHGTPLFEFDLHLENLIDIWIKNVISR